MAGLFNIGGLISGLDTNTIIRQLMEIERQPVTRIKSRVSALEKERDGIRDLRTQLLTLRSRLQDFRLDSVFSQHTAKSSEEKVATATAGANPVVGSYTVNVTRLASATSAVSAASLGAAIDPDAALNASGISTEVSGTKFSINGVQFSFDPAAHSLHDVLDMINSGGTGVTASYDATSDKVTLTNTDPGDTSIIILGGSDDDSNLLDVLGLRQATQSTNGSGSTEVTSTRNLGSIDPSEDLGAVRFRGGPATSGTFQINGVTITVDTATDSVADVIQRINDSDAQVTASYDTATDTVRLVSDVLGSRTIRFTSGTSNFLEVTGLSAAVQTAGQDSQFSINGGPVQTRNTNEVSDAIGGVTLKLLSEGTSTVAVAADEDAIVEKVNAFLSEFNNAVNKIQSLVGNNGSARGDSSLRLIENFLRTTLFSPLSGVAGDYASLAEIGITTGNNFDSTATPQAQLDKDKFLEAFRGDASNVKKLFTNEDGTGIADQLFSYLDGITSTTGFLYERVKSNGTIDEQISAYNDRITRMEERLVQREARLRSQFTQLEMMSSTYQAEASSLASLSTAFLRF